MERAAALTKLSKLVGKGFGYRIDPKAPSKEERMTAKEASAVALAERNRITEKKRARHEAILAADKEYQDLVTEWNAATKKLKDLYGVAMHYKITVGKSNGMFFQVMAQAHSWEDAISIIEKRQKGS